MEKSNKLLEELVREDKAYKTLFYSELDEYLLRLIEKRNDKSLTSKIKKIRGHKNIFWERERARLLAIKYIEKQKEYYKQTGNEKQTKKTEKLINYMYNKSEFDKKINFLSAKEEEKNIRIKERKNILLTAGVSTIMLLFALKAGSNISFDFNKKDDPYLINKNINQTTISRYEKDINDFYGIDFNFSNFKEYHLLLPVNGKHISNNKWFDDTFHYSITSGFGEKRNRSEFYPGRKGVYYHKGIDIYSGKNKKIISPIDGIIIKSEKQPSFGYGNIIQIKKENVWINNYKTGKYEYVKELVVVLAHLKQRNKKVGDRVEKGEIIGKMGYFGNDPSHRHLHYELRINGKKVNPADYYPQDLLKKF